MSSSTEQCAVCPASGSLRCSRCKQIRFCSTEHQALLWSSHKLLCKPNEPLVFRQRAVRPDELSQYATNAARQLIANENGKYKGQEVTEDEMVAKIVASDKACESNAILAWNFSFSDHAEHDAFTYTAYILMASFKVPAAHDHPARTEQSALGLLDVHNRQKAELQALVLSTLLEKNAARELVVLAVERLVAIVGDAGGRGREQLFENIRKAVVFSASRRSPVDMLHPKPLKNLEGVALIKAVEEMKAVRALRNILDILEEILGPEQ
ncbi:hypothetical protein RQP46_003829 [Phenoliferia psychrophenolica]